ncbi:hypothetical protein [Devosia sp. MC1541]|uniref:hypothetical protein n=1 Tax=Devosia sp. MC1541 TaxID=2725264 RepID=UPI00145D567A|nr:hypothetical protein [Devosia sp. MC1541]
MRRFALALAVTAVTAIPAFAQAYEGNWSCRDETTERVGILTMYGGVYGWAGRTMGDTRSGTGTVTAYQDGVGFNDGNLRANGSVQAGRITSDENFNIALQLETAEAVVMFCTVR